MEGIAILVGVRPDNVLRHLPCVECFEPLMPWKHTLKVVTIRMLIQDVRADQDPLMWMSDRDYGVALISCSDLTSQIAARCQRSLQQECV